MERLVGKSAPDFKLNAVTGDGESFREIKLKDYENKWLVMFFYPLDFTFICPTEITGFSKRYEDFKKVDAELLAVSCDSEYSHQAWIQKNPVEGGLGKINFPIASDKIYTTAKNYGVFIEEQGVSLRGL